LNILIVSRGVFPVPPKSSGGGAELHALYLAKTLADMGDNVVLIARTRKDYPRSLGVQVRSIQSRTLLGTDIGFIGWMLKHVVSSILSVIVAQYELKKRSDIELVHCHGSLTALVMTVLKGRRRLVYTAHDLTPWQATVKSHFERIVRKLSFIITDKIVWKRADFVIAVSQALRPELVRLGVNHDRHAVIPNGVSTEQTREPLANHISNRGLFVGQVTDRKGLRLLCESIKGTVARITVVGDGPGLDETKRLAHNMGVQENFDFKGYVPPSTLEDLYATAGYFVMPSLSDAFPTLAMLEAMAHGLPIVCSDLGADSGLIMNGVTALVFRRENAHELSDAIIRLDRDQILRKHLGENAREAVTHRCSWVAVAKATREVYRQVVSRDV
jgi:glycosyltransferase involved in cell wall biosynthesis